jgi:hypothetical protein
MTTLATINTDNSFTYPQRMGRIIRQAMDEVLGCRNAQKVLKHASLADLGDSAQDLPFSFEDLGRMQGSMEKLYGVRGGRGLILRSGQACFKYSLRELGPSLGLNDIAFRLLPLEAKVRRGLQIFAEMFNNTTDQHVRVEETETSFLWHIDHCQACTERQSEHATCDLVIGMLQEALYWMSGGKQFIVNVNSIPACTIQIDKRHMD